MKTLLSLDLGITTGYAVFDHNSMEPKLYGDIAFEHYEEQLKSLLTLYLPSHSVAERPVIIRGKLGDQLQEVIWITEKILMRQVDMVDAADWKQHPIAKTKLVPKLSAHTRDAIRLGMWYTHLKGN